MQTVVLWFMIYIDPIISVLLWRKGYGSNNIIRPCIFVTFHCYFRRSNLSPLGYFQTPNSFSHKIGNIDIIANFVFPHIYSLLLYLHHMFLNMKLYISSFKRIMVEGCRLHWCSSCIIAQLKRNWQYCHSCIAESLWKTLSVIQLIFRILQKLNSLIPHII